MTLNKIEKEIDKEILSIYDENVNTFDPRRRATLVDTISYMQRINSEIFINTFKRFKTRSLKERMESTTQEITRLFDLEKVTMKELRDLQGAVSSTDNFAPEINNM